MVKMVLTVLGMVAEMELSFLKERRRAGIEAAKAKGVYKGRPPTFDHAKIVALRKQGKGATEIARAVGCQRGNVYKALKASGLNRQTGATMSASGSAWLNKPATQAHLRRSQQNHGRLLPEGHGCHRPLP